MAIEKFIRGKHDDCHHDGLVSIRRREQAADYHLKHWQEESEPIEEVPLVHDGAVNLSRGGVGGAYQREVLLFSLSGEGINENNNTFIQGSQNSEYAGRSVKTTEATSQG